MGLDWFGNMEMRIHFHDLINGNGGVFLSKYFEINLFYCVIFKSENLIVFNKMIFI